MSKIFTVAKGEFYRYFLSPLAYVYLVCFLLLNGSIALYFGGVFTSGNASLRMMFDFLPWLYLIFVPGIAMRLWSEEFRGGTIVQITTLPVSINDFIWGKFLAAWAFCGVALFLTFPFVVTINVLGDPDNWVIFNSYVGAFLLAGAMLAISQTSSALTKNQVIALVISVFLNLLFFLSGLEYVLSFFREFAPEYVINLISSFSFLTHLSSFILGLMELESLVFFISLIAFFNFFTFVIINYRTTGTAFWLNTKSGLGYFSVVVLLLVAFVGINLFTNGVLKGKRIDFTEERLFTLSNSTKKVLENIKSPIVLRVYYSPILGERDEKVRESFDNLKLLLETYEVGAKGKFDYQIYNPEPLSDIEDRAIASGLQPIAVSDLNVAAYFGLVFSDEDGNSFSVPFMPLQRANLMEQDLTESIYLLGRQKKKVGLLTSLPILAEAKEGYYTQAWQIIDEITKFYSIKSIKKPTDIDESIDVLIIAHPNEMLKEMEDAIYNYSIKGGKILAFFDVAPEALYLTGTQKEFLRKSEYGDLPKKWGFKFFDNYVVADLDYSSKVSVQEADYSNTTQDLIQFFVTEKGFFGEVPEMRNLKRMLMTSASIFAPLRDANVYFIPLMEASENSQILKATAVTRNVHPAEILRHFRADKTKKALAAHVLSKDENKRFEIIVVGDSDMLYDTFWTSSVMIGNKNYSVPLLDNGNFVLNSLDVLSGDETLLDLRGKSPKIRPFEEIEKKQKQVLLDFKIKEKDIFDQIELIKKGVKEIQDKKLFEQRDNFSVDELAALNKVKTQLEEKRKDLYRIRLELNNNLEKIDAKVKFFNIYAIPLIIILCFAFINFRMFLSCKIELPNYNKKFVILSLFVFACVLLGVLGVLAQPQVYNKDIMDKPLFENLGDKINNVERIVIKNSKNTIVFEKKDKLWVLVGKPDFLVKQNRISNLLSAIVRSSIYEKKSNKIENLEKFGLLPIEDKKSKAIKISLQDNNKKEIASLDVGKHDVDLGRGAVGAYVRVANNFQVLLAKISFIDLSLDYSGWVYNDMWNLQFGRISELNGVHDVDKMVKLMSIMLNTKLTPVNKINIDKPSFSLNLKGEDFGQLQIDFYQKDEQIFVKYKFGTDMDNDVLEEFAKIVEKTTYVINVEDFKRIKDAVNGK